MGGFFRQYSWVINLAGVLFCSFFLAKITSVYLGKAIEVKRSIGVLATTEVAPMERERKNVSEYEIIVDRNIFDPVDRKAEGARDDGEGVVEEDVVPTGEAVLTTLSLNVLGVLVVGDGRDKRSSATIATGGGGGGKKDKKGRKRRGKSGGGAKVYSVGDEESFAPNTKLVLVQPDRIEFINNKRLEYAEVGGDQDASIFGPPTVAPLAAVDKGKPGAKETLIKDEGGKFTVDQREIDNALQNLDKLYTEIRAVPNFSGNKVSGMKILSVKKGSIFSKLGMRRGDVLKKINGMELDVKKGFEIFSQLKDSKSISLDLIRQGQPTTLEYEIR